MEVRSDQDAIRQPGCVKVLVAFGARTMSPQECAGLAPGSVIELDSFADDYVDLYADDRLVARGRAAVMDEMLALRVQEVLAAVPLASSRALSA